MRLAERLRDPDEVLLGWLVGLPLGQSLEQIRNAAGLSRREVAEACGLQSASMVGKWETQQTGWSRHSGLRYARLLKQHEAELAPGKDTAVPNYRKTNTLSRRAFSPHSLSSPATVILCAVLIGTRLRARPRGAHRHRPAVRSAGSEASTSQARSLPASCAKQRSGVAPIELVAGRVRRVVDELIDARTGTDAVRPRVCGSQCRIGTVGQAPSITGRKWQRSVGGGHP